MSVKMISYARSRYHEMVRDFKMTFTAAEECRWYYLRTNGDVDRYCRYLFDTKL